MQNNNLWLTEPQDVPHPVVDETATAPPPDFETPPAARVSPVSSLNPPLHKALPLEPQTGTASLWVAGCHGGAGASTLAALRPGWVSTQGAWPSAGSDAAPVVLVARTHLKGLEAAQAALHQWASGATGTHRELLGLVLVADAPSRLPKPLRDLCEVIVGGAPRHWVLPWVEQWRYLTPTPEDLPRSTRRLVGDLATLAAPETK